MRRPKLQLAPALTFELLRSGRSSVHGIGLPFALVMSAFTNRECSLSSMDHRSRHRSQSLFDILLLAALSHILH